ncbi:hypothetical protein AVDCRST_MAG94-2910, partial [uncultured Leptolyngbya sp.]
CGVVLILLLQISPLIKLCLLPPYLCIAVQRLVASPRAT